MLVTLVARSGGKMSVIFSDGGDAMGLVVKMAAE